MDEQMMERSAQQQPQTAQAEQTEAITEAAEQQPLTAQQPKPAENTPQPENENTQKEEVPQAKSEDPQEEKPQAESAEPQAEEAEPEQQPEPKEPERVTVVDVRFRNNAKTYFFDPGALRPEPGAHVIIETARGDEFGICAGGCHTVQASQIVPPLRKVLRLATAQDERINRENQEREKRAFEVCQQKILDHKMDMQLVSAELAFDGSKILFFFTAEGRVDFRELVKDLASSFRTRIELRQIGVRDKAKMVGGLGVCGRPFCCKEFLDDFQPVSIKMAKTQNLSLNPTKISGTCGRLMCCLKYEQEAYEDLLKTAPKNESFVDTPDGRGTVTEVNLLRQCVKVRMEDSPDTVGCYKNCDICVLRSGKARKNDPPIPKDLAPISSKPRKVQPKEEDAFEPLPELIYPDQVSVFDQQSIFGAQSELFAEEKKTPAPEEEEKQQTAEKTAGQNRRRRRRNRPKSADGAPEGKPQQERPAEKPAGQTEKPAEPRRDKRPNEQKPRPPRQSGEKKPQQKASSDQKPQADPAAKSADGAPKRPRRRRYHGNKPAGGSPQQGE